MGKSENGESRSDSMPFRKQMVRFKEMLAAAGAMIPSFPVFPDERTPEDRDIFYKLSTIIVNDIGEGITVGTVMDSAFKMELNDNRIRILRNKIYFGVFQIEQSCGIIWLRHFCSSPRLFFVLTIVYMI